MTADRRRMIDGEQLLLWWSSVWECWARGAGGGDGSTGGQTVRSSMWDFQKHSHCSSGLSKGKLSWQEAEGPMGRGGPRIAISYIHLTQRSMSNTWPAHTHTALNLLQFYILHSVRTKATSAALVCFYPISLYVYLTGLYKSYSFQLITHKAWGKTFRNHFWTIKPK